MEVLYGKFMWGIINIYIYILTADYTVKPVLSGHLKKKTKIVFLVWLSLNAGQKYSRMLQREHSAILLTFIERQFVIKIFLLSFFEWPLKTGFTVLTTYMYFLFCGVRRLAVRWMFLSKLDFSRIERIGPLGPIALESDRPYFEIMGQWSRPTINQGLPPRCAVRELWPDCMETQTRLSESSLLNDTINTKITFTVKPVLSGHSKIDK